MTTQELAQVAKHELGEDQLKEDQLTEDQLGEEAHEAKEVADAHGGDMPSLMAPIASLQTGFTTKSQPILHWYISGPYTGDIEFTLNEYGVTEPVLETHIPGPEKEGIYEINLADHNVTLRPDTVYEWFIIIVPLPDERSADFLGSATIKYVRPSEDTSERLANTPADALYYEYAREGYWYDAIESLSRMISNRPDDKTLRSHRIALFEQVKLGKVIDYDKRG